MLSGVAVMDAAILLVAGNDTCPQPQTTEHMAVIEATDVKDIIIVQNKIDLLKKQQALENYAQIKNFVKGTKAENSPIVPISAYCKLNIDSLCHYICQIPLPVRDLTSDPEFVVIRFVSSFLLVIISRSFDINKPNKENIKIQVGVVGGTLLKGVLKVGDNVEIRPGVINKDNEGHVISCTPIKSKIVSLASDKNELLYAIPGGLIGVGLEIDPEYTKSNGLVGSVRDRKSVV